MYNQRMQFDPVLGRKNDGLGFGIICGSKFQAGHLPSGVIRGSRTITVSASGGNDSGWGSDMDIGFDSDDEVYDGHYSVETSPQDDKFPNVGTLKSKDSFNKHIGNATNDELQKKMWNHLESVQPGHVVKCSSNSVASSKTTTSVPFSIGNKSASSWESNWKSSRQSLKLSKSDIPSAPPLGGSLHKCDQVAEQRKIFAADDISFPEISGCSVEMDEAKTYKTATAGSAKDGQSDPSGRAGGVPSNSSSALFPTYHAGGRGSWQGFVAYEACIRLCLHSWAKGCHEAPAFLENECASLRDAFGARQVLLQSEEELLRKRSLELVSEGASMKPKKTFGKLKVQVRKVKMALDPPTGCSFSTLKPPKVKLEAIRAQLSNVKSTLSSEWGAIRKVRVAPRIPPNGSLSHQSLAYLHAGTRYVKDVSGILKLGVTTLRSHSASYEVVPETYFCSLRLKSLPEEDTVKMQAGSAETHLFLPEGLGDDLIVEVHDSKGNYCGRAFAQVADIADDPGDKLRWWSIYHEPEHELVGRVQLYINYSTSPDENSNTKCGPVAETVAYDSVLEAAMKVQQFQQRNLLLHGAWRWLVTEFASYYGVSDAYTRLRYLTYVMDVATPTADCLNLVYDLLLPVVSKTKNSLSHQENRILGEISEKIELIVALVFENYKSLDESLPSGMNDVFKSATRVAAPALSPALKLYSLLNDILSPEAQLKLCRYFQTAAKKRSRRHLAETDEFVSNNNDNILMDPMARSTAYHKMVSLCSNIRNEVCTDMEINNQNILPSFLDLPNLSSSIYSAELCSRLRAFLVACPPTGPSSPVAELIVTTADLQKDFSAWNISPVKGGVDAKELFHPYITLWIKEKRLALLELCKPDKIKWPCVDTQHSTTPFVDDIYDRLKETLAEYDAVIRRWPEYLFSLETAIADVEKAVIETLDRQYADVLSPLKENIMPIKLGLKYVQKITKGTVSPFVVCKELGILLNSMKRMLDVLRPQIELQFKSWGSCLPDGGHVTPGERISEITVMLRTKFRGYMQAIMDKLVENTRMHSPTKLKKIIQDAKEGTQESDLRVRIQPLKDLLDNAIEQLHMVFETQVFIIICRGYWDRMGQDVLKFLEERKDNRSWYKASRVAVSILDDIFASGMQKYLGNALQEKDLEPPRSIADVRSMLCKDAVNDNDNNYFY
ncbi:uncharacterized protein LOC129897964 isoform X1 [Solanum dulcamara]|uniref:uncharacterized protein LOC129897964 isoform X1 n=1 Tax=Solanum dulcamara TaxID=45834 RepID=UPI002486561A|nr:uncharacterized protein LOC129897964 isoform X1 [Solanum dulcamara]